MPFASVELFDIAQLHGVTEGVTVHFLQETCSHTEGHIFGRITGVHHSLQDGTDIVTVNPVALNNAGASDHTIALGIGCTTIGILKRAQAFEHAGRWVTRVGTNHMKTAGRFHILSNLRKNFVQKARVIIAVGNRGKHTVGELSNNKPHAIELTLMRRHDRVFGGRNRRTDWFTTVAPVLRIPGCCAGIGTVRVQ